MEKNQSLDLIYEETKIQIIRQFQTITALDIKAHITAGLAAVILSLVLTKTQPLPKSCFLTIVLLLLSFGLSLIGFWIRGWYSDPLPSGMKDYLDKEEMDSKRQFLENLIKSYSKNSRSINKKATFIKFSMGCLLAGLVTVAVLLICTK